MPEPVKPQADQPLGVPPSEFHPERPATPFKKRGNVKTAILVGVLIVIVDILIYFLFIKPDDSHLFKAIEPLKPQSVSTAPSVVVPSVVEQTNPSRMPENVSKVSTLAKDDLAKRLKIDASQIEVISEEPTTWNDGSMGCPQPDMMYTQALVEGTKVVLSAQQKNFDYHAGANDEPFLCEKKLN